VNPIGNTLNRLGGWIARPFRAIPSTEPHAGQGELAWSEGLFFGRVPLERWNPDDLITRHGYAIYRKMMTDDQVSALVSLKQSVITGRPWQIQTQDDSPAQVQCAAFFQSMLENQLTGTFQQTLRELLSSQVYGFSVLEKIFQPQEFNGQKLWAVQQLKLRPAESFTFQTDHHGNLTTLLQEQGGKRVELPRERFVLHVTRPEVHPQYGESDLRPCHRHWWAKSNILSFWNVYLERMAAGFVHGRVTGQMSPGEREELRQVMRNLNSQTSIITPGSVELQMVTAPSTDAFERAVAMRDKAMARALLVPNLLGFAEQGSTGSYSQSRTQLETFFLVMNGLADSIADTLNEQLLRDLAYWNFGLNDAPRFVFDPLSEGQRREFARAWSEVVGRGAVTNTPVDESRTRDLLGYPSLSKPPPEK